MDEHVPRRGRVTGGKQPIREADTRRTRLRSLKFEVPNHHLTRCLHGLMNTE
jgi:hypothetical protein